jgi:membrane-associated phospholipid phosphatase
MQDPARDSASLPGRPPPPLTGRARLAWLIVLIAAQVLYIPINRGLRGGVVLATPWDAAIPLWPVWAVPYLLSIAWWIGSLIWAARRMDDDLYRALVSGGLVMVLASYLFYLLCPTYVERPLLTGHDWPTELMRLIYGADRPYNAFPSSHTYNSVFVALFWCRWLPRWKPLWIGLAAIVLLSTLFTRQHNLLDLVGGTVLAWSCYRLGLWWVKRRGAKGG